MKKNRLVLAIALIALILAGCSSGLEERVDQLTEQVALLQARVDALEAENAQLQKPQQNTSVPEFDSASEESGSDPEAALILYDWLYGDGTLTIDGAFARVMSLGSDTTVLECRMVLSCNGVATEETLLSLLPGEASDSMELELESFSYYLTSLENGDLLELNLQVLLSDGRSLTAWGGNWEFWDDQLLMIAG